MLPAGTKETMDSADGKKIWPTQFLEKNRKLNLINDFEFLF